MPLILIGLSHHSAPVEVRERFAQLCVSGLPGADGRHLEAVTVLTCNRVEAYLYGNTERAEKAFADWAETSGFPYAALEPYLYKRAEQEAIDHLLKVASGLDSMVLGENQILHQVKDSYQAAISVNCVGKRLHVLFQKALEIGKRVRSETKISENTVSIASTAVDLAQRIFGPLEDSEVLVIGAGEMASLVARHVKDRGAKSLTFTNRTLSRAEELAALFSGKAAPFKDLPQLLERADIVISSTGAPRPIIDRPKLEAALAARPQRPMFAIDIAVPRDIEPNCGDIENVFLYNIDDLQNVVDENINSRRSEAAKAEQIIAEAVSQLLETINTFTAIPLIRGLRDHAEELRKIELDKFLCRHRELSPELAEEISLFSRALLAKWLHHPMLALKKTGSADREELLQIARIFGISENSVSASLLKSVKTGEEKGG